MKLFVQPDQTDADGNALPVPKHLSYLIASWSNAHYNREEFGYTVIQEFVARKFSIHLWRIVANKPATLYPSSDRPILALQFMLLGNLPCILAGYGKKILQQSRSELFYVPVGINEAFADTGEYETLHFELEQGYLEEIAEANKGVKDLIERLNNASSEGKPLLPVRIGYISRAIIRNLLASKKTGPDLVVEMNLFIVGLLSEYISGAQEQENDFARTDVPHKEKLIDIKHEIIANPHIHRQKLSTLSRKFTMSITELKKNFKKLFDVAPGEFVRMHALNKAKYLITTTTRTIDDISEEVGYNYRINFDRAFQRQFGSLPATLRSKKNNSNQIH